MKRRATKELTSTKKFQKQKRNYKTTPLKELRPETKYLDTVISTDVSTTPVVTSLNTVGTGDTVLTREANKILMKSLELRIAFANEALTSNNNIRLVVVVDKQANITNASFSGSSSSLFQSATVQALRNITSMSRYRVLKDKVISFNQTSDTAIQKGFIKMWISIPEDVNLVTFQDSTSAVPVTNNLMLMYIGDNASGIADLDIQVQSRLRFVG